MSTTLIGSEEGTGRIDGEVGGASPCRKSEGLEEVSWTGGLNNA